MPQEDEQIETKTAVDVAREEAGLGTDKAMSAAKGADPVLNGAAAFVGDAKGYMAAVDKTSAPKAKKEAVKRKLQAQINTVASITAKHVASQQLRNSNNHHHAAAINDNRARLLLMPTDALCAYAFRLPQT